jgi:hypothetical protein
VYVVDSFNNRIQKFDNAGDFIAQWGSEGADYGMFNLPMGAAVHESGRLYIADSLNHRVQVFNVSGRPCVLAALLGDDGPQIDRLRNYRDAKLARSARGRTLIDWYYKMSGMLQPLLEAHPSVKNAARKTLLLVFPLIDTIID